MCVTGSLSIIGCRFQIHPTYCCQTRVRSCRLSDLCFPVCLSVRHPWGTGLLMPQMNERQVIIHTYVGSGSCSGSVLIIALYLFKGLLSAHHYMYLDWCWNLRLRGLAWVWLPLALWRTLCLRYFLDLWDLRGCSSVWGCCAEACSPLHKVFNINLIFSCPSEKSYPPLLYCTVKSILRVLEACAGTEGSGWTNSAFIQSIKRAAFCSLCAATFSVKGYLIPKDLPEWELYAS